MKTFTITKTVTNTQLGIATAVLLGVSALAFLVIPAFTNTSTAPYYRYASWECQDGSGQGQGSPTTCTNYTAWFAQAQKFCTGRCNYSNYSRECGLLSFTVSSPCSLTSCLGQNEKIYGTLKCCAGLTNVNGICRATTSCAGLDQSTYLFSRCCAGLVELRGVCRNPNCIDLDGRNYFTATDVTNSRGAIVARDKCATKNFLGRYTIVTKGKYVAERICSKAGLDTIYYACPKGCANGACIK
jgi:hypothetical protein